MGRGALGARLEVERVWRALDLEAKRLANGRTGLGQGRPGKRHQHREGRGEHREGEAGEPEKAVVGEGETHEVP